MSFKVGTVVRLKCGGAPMVVDGFYNENPEDKALCVKWHDAQGRPRKMRVRCDSVELALPPHPFRDLGGVK